MIAIDPTIRGDKLVIRESMNKFESDFEGIEIMNNSKPCKLNQALYITNLSPILNSQDNINYKWISFIVWILYNRLYYHVVTAVCSKVKTWFPKFKGSCPSIWRIHYRCLQSTIHVLITIKCPALITTVAPSIAVCPKVETWGPKFKGSCPSIWRIHYRCLQCTIHVLITNKMSRRDYNCGSVNRGPNAVNDRRICVNLIFAFRIT